MSNTTDIIATKPRRQLSQIPGKSLDSFELLHQHHSRFSVVTIQTPRSGDEKPQHNHLRRKSHQCAPERSPHQKVPAKTRPPKTYINRSFLPQTVKKIPPRHKALYCDQIFVFVHSFFFANKRRKMNNFQMINIMTASMNQASTAISDIVMGIYQNEHNAICLQIYTEREN